MTLYTFACHRGTSFRSYRHSSLCRSGNLFRDEGAKTLTGYYWNDSERPGFINHPDILSAIQGRVSEHVLRSFLYH